MFLLTPPYFVTTRKIQYNRKIYKPHFYWFNMIKYNLPHEETKRFEIYTGKNTECMPKLIADGRVPMNVSQLMQRRLGLRNDTSGVKTFFMDNY